MEWEDTKENFVPAKHGHTAAALSTPLSVAKRSSEVEDAKRSFLEDIKTADDPLAAWQRYIKWTQEQFAAQGGKSELQQVLETATKSLSSTSSHNDDVRLLRIWVQYADCLPDPSDVFLYLENQSIGRDHALLYEAYATYLELKGNFQQAALVYQEGINRLAKPLERLKQKQAGFKQRMEKRMQRQTSEALLGVESATGTADSSTARTTLAPVLGPLVPPHLDENGNRIQHNRQQGQQRHSRPPAPAGTIAAGVRPAAGSNSTTSSRPSLFGVGSGSNAAAAAAVTAGGLFGMGRSQPAAAPAAFGAPAGAAAAAAAANGAKPFDVLVDEEFGPFGSGMRPTAFPSGHTAHSQLPGYKLGRKENTTEATEWAGQRFKQQAVYTAPTANRLEVYEDDDLAEPVQAAALEQQQQQPKGPLRQLLEAPVTEGKPSSQLLSAPQRESDLPQPAARPATQQQSLAAAEPAQGASKSQSSSASTGRGSSSAGSTAAAAAAAGTHAPQGYNAALLIGPDGSELSFEENRAAVWRAKRAKQQQHQEEQRKRLKQQQQQQEEEEEQRKRLKQQQQQEEEEEEQRKRLKQQQQEEEEEQRKRLKQQQQQQEEQRKRHKKQQAEEQELLAERLRQQEEQYRCREQQQAEERRRQQDPLEAPAAAAVKAAAAAEALKAKEAATAAAALRQEKKQQQQQQAAQLSQQRQQHHQQHQPATCPAGEPTVTINTRAALESMNFMFSQDLPTMTLPRNALAAASSLGHGYPAAGVRGGKSMGGVGVEPTVTVNTRAALEAMNGMFCCGDETMTMHGFPPQFGGPGRGGGAKQGRGGAGPEPTVTVNTRQAFECMNDMFGDITGQQTMTGRQMMAARAEQKGGHSRLSTATAAAGGGGWQLHEDTELLHNTRGLTGRGVTGGLGPSDGQMGWEVREDTEFVGNISRAAGGGLEMGLGLCEDTEFLTRPVGSSAASNQYNVYEDTDYLNMPAVHMPATQAISGLHRLSLANRASGACQARGGVANEAPGALSLSLHEDTDLLTSHTAAAATAAGGVNRSTIASNRNAAAAVAAASGSRGVRSMGGGVGLGLELHEDTELLTTDMAKRGNTRAGGIGVSVGRGLMAAGFIGSRDTENGPLSGLGLHEDTELLANHTTAAAAAAAAEKVVHSNYGMPVRAASGTDIRCDDLSAGGLALGLHEDTELLPTHGTVVAPRTAFGQAGSSSSRDCVSDECSDTTTGLLRIKENLPVAALPRGHRVPFGSAAAATTGAGRHGSSRLGHSSAPGSPAGHHGPAWGSTTPGKPPLGSMGPGGLPVYANATPDRGPRTPGTPWAQPMDEFEVMESPAVREALAGRPVTQMSPAASMPSPGVGSIENLASENGDAQLKPRRMHDRASRAAALQPLSDSRAKLLGVEVDPMGEAAGGDEGDEASTRAAAGGGQSVRAGGKPNALRSLVFQG